MASSLLDVCRFNPVVGGTTDWTYSSAVTGYQSPTAAGAVNGAIYSYRAESNDLSQWEVGYGAYNSSTGVVARTTVLFNSAGTTAKINFTTVPQVAVVALAEDLLSFNAAMSLTEAQKAQAKANLGVPGYNYLLNPSGEIAQVSVGSPANGAYDFDQWVVLTQTAAVAASQPNNLENGTPFAMRLTQSQATAQRMGRIQWMENSRVNALRGQNVVLSARVQMSATTTLRYAIIEWIGTADAITKDVVNSWTNTIFTTGNFFRVAGLTIVATGSIGLTANTLTDITALTGAVSGSMNNLAVFFWTDSAVAQNVTLDVAKSKLELGTVNTPFISRSSADELRDCQRFFEVGNEPIFYLPGQNSNTIFITYKYSVIKRVAPTVTYTGWSYYNSGTPTAITPTSNGIYVFHVEVFLSGLTNGNGLTNAGSITLNARL